MHFFAIDIVGSNHRNGMLGDEACNVMEALPMADVSRHGSPQEQGLSLPSAMCGAGMTTLPIITSARCVREVSFNLPWDSRAMG